MAKLITSNNAVGTIDNGLSSTATTLVLNSLTNFPFLVDAGDYCILTLIRESDGALEYVKCTSQNVNNRSYEITRGQEGSTPLVFLEGDSVRNLLTAEQIDSFLSSEGDTSTGSYTFGALSIGTGGPLALTLNDGYGNTNVCFNHKSGKADQNGNAGRITVNTDAISSPTMDFQLGANLSSGTPTSLTDGMILSQTDLKPKTADTVSLGSSDRAWDDLWLNGTIDIGATTLSSSQLKIGPTVLDTNRMELGDNSNTFTYIDLHATSDASQSDYSSRISRGGGVNGVFEILNKGTGNLRLESGSGVILDPTNNLISVSDSKIIDLVNPTSAQDAATKAYVDSIGGYGALLASVSLNNATDENGAWITWNATWDSYDFVQLVGESITTNSNGGWIQVRRKDSQGSTFGSTIASGAPSGNLFDALAPGGLLFLTNNGFKASFMYEMSLGGATLTPMLQRLNAANQGALPVLPQGHYTDTVGATGVPGVTLDSDPNYIDVPHDPAGTWGFECRPNNGVTLTGGNFRLYGFNYPT